MHRQETIELLKQSGAGSFGAYFAFSSGLLFWRALFCVWSWVPCLRLCDVDGLVIMPMVLLMLLMMLNFMLLMIKLLVLMTL